jgi:hypothetical protein
MAISVGSTGFSAVLAVTCAGTGAADEQQLANVWHAGSCADERRCRTQHAVLTVEVGALVSAHWQPVARIMYVLCMVSIPLFPMG